MFSSTEENYLKAIYKLSAEDKAVSTNDVSQLLGTTPASVTDMIKKLSEKKLVHHQPYKGVKLSASGKRYALDIIRKHRLWEVFLVEKLKFNWDKIHDIAEQLEHIEAPELIRKLDAYLGFPRFDPHGDPIPDESGAFTPRNTIVLKDCKAGDQLAVAGVLLHTPEFLQYLDRQQLTPGTRVKIREILPFDHSVVLQADKQILTVSAMVSEHLLMIKVKH